MAHHVNDATLEPENYTTPGDVTHVAHEVVQLSPHPLDLIRPHAVRLTVRRTINKNLTKYY